jgi:hypothetical protein
MRLSMRTRSSGRQPESARARPTPPRARASPCAQRRPSRGSAKRTVAADAPAQVRAERQVRLEAFLHFGQVAGTDALHNRFGGHVVDGEQLRAWRDAHPRSGRAVANAHHHRLALDQLHRDADLAVADALARLLLRHERARRNHPEVRLLQLAEHRVQHGVEGGVALGGARFWGVGLAHRVPVHATQLRVVVRAAHLLPHELEHLHPLLLRQPLAGRTGKEGECER